MRTAWTPVTDRRPEPGQFVLAYGACCQGWVNGPLIAVFRWYDDSWWDANMDAEVAEGIPTHWMPLPDLPRAQSTPQPAGPSAPTS
jgi:hypothetical protein